MIKYLRTSIVFQEIPNEISLAIEITNCPNRCKNCHTPELQQDIGAELSETRLRELIEFNRVNEKFFLISCVLFMGGDQHEELKSLIKVVKEYNLMAALYTGNNFVSANMEDLLDYLKTGSYVEELGNLKSETTNQVLYRIIHSVPKKYEMLSLIK